MNLLRRKLRPVQPERLPLLFRLRAARRRAYTVLQQILAGLLSPSLIVAALLLASAGCFVAGIYTLFGFGWSLIAGSAAFLLLAAALARGMTDG